MGQELEAQVLGKVGAGLDDRGKVWWKEGLKS